MSSSNKRRSQSVENLPEQDQFNSNKRMYKSQSNQNLRAGSQMKNLKGKSSVLNRPGTIAALSALSVGGFSQNISSNALRNAHPQWSFSKGDRFRKLKIDNSAKMLVLPSTLNAKTSTFGFGKREPLKMIFGKDSPPPTLYRSRSQFDYRPGAGKSIGQSYAVYKKVHMPGLNTRSDEVPGPGNYELKTTLGANSRKFSLKSRIKPADSATRDNPPPNTYNPTYTQAEESKFDKITFGFGSRPNVTGRINENPGPGTYRIPSVFDKFRKIPNASLLKTLQKYKSQTRRRIAKPQMSSRSSAKQISSQHDEDQEEQLAVKEDGETPSQKESQKSISNDESNP
jgi:hypothetical protein